MRGALHLVGLVLWLYTVVLMVRLGFDWVQFFNRNFRPRGVVLVIAEAVYTVTDPPLKAVRRFIRPVRIGSMALDLGFTLVLLVVLVASQALMMA